jgi:hypothetical protein
LSAFVLAIWAWHHGAWSRESWTTPTDYRGDSHEILARLKAASEGDTWPLRQQVISRLGAPWGAHWSEYPTTDKLLVIALGGIVRFAGLGVAANFALVMAAMTAAWAFFFASRRLGAAWEWAFVGALLFAFSCSVFQRGLAHLLLLYTWTVPAGLLACAYVARSQRLSWTASEAWVCGFAAVGLGLSNPYHLFFWGQLLVWAVILRVVRDGRATSIKVGFATGALSLGAVISSSTTPPGTALARGMGVAWASMLVNIDTSSAVVTAHPFHSLIYPISVTRARIDPMANRASTTSPGAASCALRKTLPS